jgi:DNA repair exonuclease SbcCD nuclease subunit
MKIAVLSDFHFGYGYNTDLEEDSFLNAEEAVEKALGSDLIINAGDIFDTKFPKTPVWSRAVKILTKPVLADNSGIRLVSCTKRLKSISKRTLDHIPMVALHGNHERRGKDTNTLEVLENAGLLVHLNCDTIIFEKDGVKVAVHGMSWVPERYAKKILDEWSPVPLPDCFNILVLHQSISPFIYSPLDKPTLNKDNLPKGFDVIVNGHIHDASSENIGIPFIMPGSTVITQFNKSEAKGEKGFYEIEADYDDDGNKKIGFKFIALENSRKFFFEDVDINGDLRNTVESRISRIMERGFKKKPLIKFKIKGNDSEYSEKDVKDILKNYEDMAILRFVKDLDSPEISEKVEFLRNIRDQKMSAEEIGLRLLHKNLNDMSFDSSFEPEGMFSLLVEGRIEDAFSMLTKED